MSGPWSWTSALAKERRRRSGHREAHRDRQSSSGTPEFMSPRAEQHAASNSRSTAPLRHLRPRHRRLRDVHGRKNCRSRGPERPGNDDRPAARPAAGSCGQLRPDLPEGLESALARAMDANADARYNTALEFRRGAHGVALRRLPVEDQGEAEIRRFPASIRPEYVRVEAGSRPGARLPRDDRAESRSAPPSWLASRWRPRSPCTPACCGAPRLARHPAQAVGARRASFPRHGSGPARRRPPSGPVHALERGTTIRVAPMIPERRRPCL